MLKLHEAAKELKTSVQTIRSWIHSGKIAYIKLGGRYFISEITIGELQTPTHAIKPE